MTTLPILQLVGQPILVSRSSARALEPELERALRDGNGGARLDFAGVMGVTPSFLDEILSVISRFKSVNQGQVQVEVIHPPTRLSSKFSAVGRGHQLAIRESGNGWLITRDSAA